MVGLGVDARMPARLRGLVVLCLMPDGWPRLGFLCCVGFLAVSAVEGQLTLMESLILAQDERWRRA